MNISTLTFCIDPFVMHLRIIKQRLPQLLGKIVLFWFRQRLFWNGYGSYKGSSFHIGLSRDSYFELLARNMWVAIIRDDDIS